MTQRTHSTAILSRAPLHPERFAYACAATIFLGAVLLFQVQPMIGKMVLPWFGGSPSVWTTCMLFFQVLLVGGYAYADLLGRWRSRRAVAVVHAVLLLSTVCLLPITPASTWKPDGQANPTWYLLLLLGVHVGLPYFLLASTGPLLQNWFARVYPQRSPYRLYALSNAGSMGALLSYPFLVEPTLNTVWQGWMWSGAFVLFAVMCAGLALSFQRQANLEQSTTSKSTAKKNLKPSQSTAQDKPASDDGASLSWTHRLLWIVLPAFACVMLLAVTNYLCQDVAVSPLMWVVPLSLYLLTFIICFDRESWYSRRIYSLVALVAVMMVCNFMLASHMEILYRDLGINFDYSNFVRRLDVQAFAFLFLLFTVCLLCHGELVRLKPAPRYLTTFYLSVSVGGALGGILVGVVCPAIFSGYHELHLAIIAAALFSGYVFGQEAFRTWLREKRLYKALCGVAALVGLYVVFWSQTERMATSAVAIERNFYGVLWLQDHFQDSTEEPSWYGRALYHGRILHGYQYLTPGRERVPTTYYMENSGVGLTLRNFPRPADRGLRVGLVGLGAGTLACYGEAGDHYTFYEINPQVIDFAKTYFTFLSDCPAELDFQLGDARLSLERSELPPDDVLVLDAFSGDAIPTHLLTREAFELYEQRLAPGGVLCVHVSNRHLRLEPVVARLADEAGWSIVTIAKRGAVGLAETESDWMLLTRNEAFLQLPAIADVQRSPERDPTMPLWTDGYHNLLRILR